MLFFFTFLNEIITVSGLYNYLKNDHLATRVYSQCLRISRYMNVIFSFY